jgi:hypothetical protein
MCLRVYVLMCLRWCVHPGDVPLARLIHEINRSAQEET